jgi:hypothetical protein
MIFKLICLIAALKLHDIKPHPYAPTLLYSVPLILFGLLLGSSIIGAIIGGIITLCVAFAYFLLLTKFNRGIEYFAIMGLGGVLLILFI